MKELSIEEKARRYDGAIKRLEDIETGKCQKTFMFTEGLFNYIFPELVESEDERIRKWLIYYFKEVCDNVSEKEKKGVLDWLEKQGEQMPVGKVEPKFHEGDIIIHKELGGDYIHNPHKIIQVDILDKKYRLEGGLVAHFGEQEDYELVEQKPAEWSEEDKAHIDSLLKRLEGMCKPDATFISTEFAISEDEDWLKSIRHRSQWKPSDEQMDALLVKIPIENSCNKVDNILKSLYSDLKKLK